MNIKNLLNSGQVVRFHNHVGIDKQSLAEHQWGVAMIVQYIEPECSKDLLLAALTHDAAEYYTGDMPFPTKQANPKLKSMLEELEKDWLAENGLAGPFVNLTQPERVVLKAADTLEGMWYCTLQMKQGNKCADRPFRKWLDFMERLMMDVKVTEETEMMFKFVLKEREKWL